MSSQAPAGWYPQPDGTQRWWTGTAWSDAAPASGAVVHGELVRPQPGPVPYPSVPTSYPLPPGQPAPLVAGTHGYAPAVRVAPKNAGVAVIASFFLPGLGQFINGQAGKGLLFLACYLIGIPLLFFLVGFLILPVVWVWSMIDAYSSAQAWNARYGILS